MATQTMIMEAMVPTQRIVATMVVSRAMVKAMKHDTFANYLKSAGLTPEASVAGHEVWNKHIKEEYAKAEAALKALGIIK